MRLINSVLLGACLCAANAVSDPKLAETFGVEPLDGLSSDEPQNDKLLDAEPHDDESHEKELMKDEPLADESVDPSYDEWVTETECQVGYGVGFGLATDYGAASVYFCNGSTVDIAKVEGSPAYKAFMRAAVHIHSSEVVSPTDPSAIRDPSECDCHSEEEPTLLSRMTARSLSILRRYLPSWLYASKPNADIQALTDMLRALTTASNAYLSTPILNATIATPFPVSRKPFQTHLKSASTSLHLQLRGPFQATELTPMVSSIPTRLYNAIEGWDEKAEGYVLGLDLNDDSLTATLVEVEYGLSKPVRHLHSTELGAKALKFTNEPHAWRDNLASALRNITALPLPRTEPNPDPLRQIVIFGAAAQNPHLRTTLRQVFGAELPGLLSTGSGEQHRKPSDPYTLPATNAAHWNHFQSLRDENRFSRTWAPPFYRHYSVGENFRWGVLEPLREYKLLARVHWHYRYLYLERAFDPWLEKVEDAWLWVAHRGVWEEREAERALEAWREREREEEVGRPKGIGGS